MILILLISQYSHAGLLIDGFSKQNKKEFLDDLVKLKDWSYSINNRWFYDNLGVYSGSGQQWYDWFSKRTQLVFGESFEFKPCIIDSSTIYNCASVSQTPSLSTNNIPRLEMIDPGFSLIAIDLMSKEKEKNGLLLSGGEVLPLYVNNTNALWLRTGYSKLSLLLDDESKHWYRVAHYIGLARMSELYSLNETVLKKCDTVVGTELICESKKNGPLSITGMLLRDFAAICKSCSTQSKLVMYYVSADYLLRVPGDNELRQIAYKIMRDNQSAMSSIGLDVSRINNIYRWSLTTKDTLN